MEVGVSRGVGNRQRPDRRSRRDNPAIPDPVSGHVDANLDCERAVTRQCAQSAYADTLGNDLGAIQHFKNAGAIVLTHGHALGHDQLRGGARHRDSALRILVLADADKLG